MYGDFVLEDYLNHKANSCDMRGKFVHPMNRCAASLILFVCIIATVQSYEEEAIIVKPPGFHVGDIYHEVESNQIVVKLSLSSSANTIPIIYMSKEGWDIDNPLSDNINNNPCEKGPESNNNICCLNTLVANYEVAPSMLVLRDNAHICPYDNATGLWSQNYTDISSENAELSGHTMGVNRGYSDIFSTGVNDSFVGNRSDALLYPAFVKYTVLGSNDGLVDIELRLSHLYVKPRSKKTIIGSSSSGMAKYQFYLGVTYVNLNDFSSGVGINSAQVSLEYYKSEFVFLSIATEQESTPVRQMDLVIHEARSTNNNNLYQYMELDVLYDTVRYPGRAKIEPESLRWARSPSYEEASVWNYACIPETGYYYTGDQLALDSLSQQTCLPQAPIFCQFDMDNQFSVPFPTEFAGETSGFLAGPDAVNNLYVQFTLKLTDSAGVEHLSTIFTSVDLISFPVLEHCQDAVFEYNEVGDALRITASVGVKATADSSVKLAQEKTGNRNINEIVPNSPLAGRRLLQDSSDDKSGFNRAQSRHLLQSDGYSVEDGSTLTTAGCHPPVCGFNRGADMLSECTVNGCYECESCKRVGTVYDPFTLNSTRFSCGWQGCTVGFSDGDFKSWGGNWKKQQLGMYPTSSPWKPTGEVVDGWMGSGRIVNDLVQGPSIIARLPFASWGDDLKIRIWKFMGQKKMVGVFTDNSIRVWGDGVKYDVTLGVAAVTLLPQESIVELSTRSNDYMIRTDAGRVFHSSDLVNPINLGTEKNVKQISSAVWVWYFLFEDGSVKSISDGNQYGLYGYSDLGVDGVSFSGYTIETVRNAPFINFGQRVKQMKSFTAPAMNGSSYTDDNAWGRASTNGDVANNFAMQEASAMGSAHMCAIMEDDSLKCWGSNWAGQLGYEDIKDRGYSYTQNKAVGGRPTSENNVKDIPAVDVGAGRTVLDMCLGTSSTCVVLDNYKVKCWGGNWAGNLGQGDRIQRGHYGATMGDKLPFIDVGSDVKVVKVECYQSSVCVMTMNGTIKCFGRNCGDSFGELGTGSVLPYGDNGIKPLEGEDPSLCKDRGAGQGDTTGGFSDFMGDALPYVKLDCATKDQSLQNIGGCVGNGRTARPKEPGPVCGTSVVGTIKVNINIPIGFEDFTEAVERKFLNAIATVASVAVSNVVISSLTDVSTSRRLLAAAIDVQVTIVADPGKSIAYVESELTTPILNQYLRLLAPELPTSAVTSVDVTTGIIAGTAVDFKGASSYVEGSIAIELDAVEFMGYAYAKDYTYRIDNMVILNFLGENEANYGRINNLIGSGAGFIVAKQDGNDHYTLTPDFGDDVLCQEVNGTAITSGHMKCFWRNAIEDNSVLPVAQESLYYYRNEVEGDADLATTWIRDTILGGGSAFSLSTADDYFQRTCSRYSDVTTEPRSYGCIYVDPGYRWTSRLRGQRGAPVSPFTISDKTIVVAILTIANADGNIIRRRLLSSDGSQTRTHSMPKTRPLKGDSTHRNEIAVAKNSRKLLAVDKSAALQTTTGNTAFSFQNSNVDEILNMVYIKGLRNQRFQGLELPALLSKNVDSDIYRKNFDAALSILGPRFGDHVMKAYTISIEQELGPIESGRRLLDADHADSDSSHLNISLLVQNGNSFGSLYTDELECVVSKLATRTTLLNAADLKALVAGCDRGTLSIDNRKFLLSKLSSCGMDMEMINIAECNTLNALLLVFPTVLPMNAAVFAEQTPVLSFDINLDMLLENVMRDSSAGDVIRKSVADAIGLNVDRVAVVFTEIEVDNGLRRLLAMVRNVRATVYAYEDTRSAYSSLPFNALSNADRGVAYESSTGWKQSIDSSLASAVFLRASPAGVVRTSSIAKPFSPALKQYKTIVRLKLQSVLTESQVWTVFGLLRDSFQSDISTSTAFSMSDLSLNDFGMDASSTQLQLWIRSETQEVATALSNELYTMQGQITADVLIRLQASSDIDINTFAASEVTVEVDVAATPVVDKKTSSNTVTIVIVVFVVLVCVMLIVVAFMNREHLKVAFNMDSKSQFTKVPLSEGNGMFKGVFIDVTQ